MNESFEKLKQDIVSSLDLQSQNSSGWMTCYCPVCQKKDRMTAGLKVDHDAIAFNCFRASCDASCAYELDQPVSKKFRSLVDAIGVDIPIDIKTIRSSFHKRLQESLDEDLYKKHVYKEMSIPNNYIPLDQAKGSNVSYWFDYFGGRCCSVDDIFYIKSGQHKGKVAIGCYFFDKLIGFQIINNRTPSKYINETINNHLIYINERHLRDPIIVVEGALDAKCFPNAVGLLSHSITPEKAYQLRGRRVILLPDRKGGDRFIDTSRDYGWEVCIPPWEEKDLNQAVQRFGVIACSDMIAKNIFSEKTKIELMYNMWKC